MKHTDAVLQAILARAIAAAGPFDPAALFLGVATAITDLGVNTTMAQVTEATGAMLTRVAITPWGTPYKLASGSWVVDGPIAIFAPASAAEAQVLSHWFLASAAVAGTLKSFEALTPARTMSDENSQLNIIPRLTVDPTGNVAVSIVFDG